MALPKKPDLHSVTTINPDGSRYFLHPADVRGFWNVWRRVVGWLLIGLYVALPWIPINGYPAVFLDVENRLFHLFGITLVPQDLWVLFFAMTGLGFGLFVVTSVMGRIWCGWACPYTVFLDHVYRRIERWLEGDAQARRALDRAPWTFKKVSLRVIKHLAYAAVSAAIANVFLSYFVSLPRLYGFMLAGPLQHATAFGVMLATMLSLWFCFGWFREQFCVIVCPYGRLQSALTDDHTINVGYDALRGEPRGTLGKVAGDCIDCRRCVQVCPTGIDIRDGLQLECIGCTACIDACDDIMEKVGRPPGLIRYDSLHGFAGEKRQIVRPRLFAYAGMALLGLIVLITVSTIKARPYQIDVARLTGAPYLSDGASIRNLYKVRVVNKRNQPITAQIELAPIAQRAGWQLSGVDEPFEVPALAEVSRVCVVVMPLERYRGASEVQLEIRTDPGDYRVEKQVRFLGPPPARTFNP